MHDHHQATAHLQNVHPRLNIASACSSRRVDLCLGLDEEPACCFMQYEDGGASRDDRTTRDIPSSAQTPGVKTLWVEIPTEPLPAFKTHQPVPEGIKPGGRRPGTRNSRGKKASHPTAERFGWGNERSGAVLNFTRFAPALVLYIRGES